MPGPSQRSCAAVSGPSVRRSAYISSVMSVIPIRPVRLAVAARGESRAQAKVNRRSVIQSDRLSDRARDKGLETVSQLVLPR